MKKSVIISDIHHPYQNRLAFSSVLNFLKDFVPDEVLLLGDIMDCQTLNSHEQGNLRHFETKRLIGDYRALENEIIYPINKVCPKAKKIYLAGNHEQWIEFAIDKDPSKLEGIIELENNVDLKGWEYIPYLKKKGRGIELGRYNIGKLHCIHGEYTNQYHAAKTVNAYGRSVVYGHSHTIQSHTQLTAGNISDFHIAWSIGCLCNLSPSYMKGGANKWVNGFAIVYSDEKTGNFNLYQVVIFNNKFIWNDKIYKPL